MEEQNMTALEQITAILIEFAPKFLTALAIILIGFWVLKKLRKFIIPVLTRTGLPEDVARFVYSLLDIILKIVLLLSAAGIVGIDTASVLALLATAGIAIGLALQGSLGNFAAGIVIMVFRPYRVGDWVEIQDKFGKVEDIQIFNTILGTPGNKTLIIPNGQVIDGIITNFSDKGMIRIEMEVTMPYEEDYPKVEAIIREVLKNAPKVLNEPEPEIGILTYDSHNLVIGVRPYSLPDDYWEVRFDVYRRIKRAFHNNNINVAYSEGVEIGKIGA